MTPPRPALWPLLLLAACAAPAADPIAEDAQWREQVKLADLAQCHVASQAAAGLAEAAFAAAVDACMRQRGYQRVEQPGGASTALLSGPRGP